MKNAMGSVASGILAPVRAVGDRAPEPIKRVASRNLVRSSRNERLQLIMYGAVLVGLVWGALHTLTQVTTTVAALCNYPAGDARLQPAQWIPLAGIVGVFAGRYFNRLRAPTRQPTPSASSPRGQPDRKRWRAFSTALAMLGVFVMLVGIWFYEAIGTAHVRVHEGGVAVFEPITYYVRCAAIVDRAEIGLSPWSLISVFLFGLVAGDWFWSSNRANAAKRDEINQRKRARYARPVTVEARPRGSA